MEEVTVSFRVQKQIHELMKSHDEINWSSIFRNSISRTLESVHSIDKRKGEIASREMDRLRQINAFSAGKSSTEVIREWRNKRK